MQQLATIITGTQLQLVFSVQLTRLSLAWPTVSAAPIPSVVAPSSERPVYPALPAQRPCLLATHNILVQKTTALLILAEHSLILHQVARPSGTHGVAEQYVHYLVNIKGPRSRQLRGSRTTMKRDSISQGHRCGHGLDSGSTSIE